MAEKHPLDIELADLADHLQGCSLCRLKFQRLLGLPVFPSLSTAISPDPTPDWDEE